MTDQTNRGSDAQGQAADTAQGRITIDLRRVLGRLDDAVFGHFIEQAFFGNIEGGVFDEGSPLAVSASDEARDGLRTDVIELCRDLGVNVLRWPGGNVTSAYHFTDGLGPRDARPRRLELAWGNEESNRFGTEEFLAFCREIDAEPYLAHSCRDVDEAVRWIEYTNVAGDTDFTRQRAANGHAEPHRVRYWGIGNEVYGPWQMGHRSAEAYARDAREHARFMRLVDPSITTIGVGLHRDEHWNHEVLRHAGEYLDLLSIHLYGVSTHLAHDASDPVAEFDQVVAQASYFETELVEYSYLVGDLAERLGLGRRFGLALDEWNVRHVEPASWPDPQAGARGGVAERDVPSVAPDDLLHPDRVNRWSPRTLADALCYAGVFTAIQRMVGSAVPVTMANPVNLVNANGVVVARPEGAVRSAVFGVFRLFGRVMDRRVVACRVESPARTMTVRQGHQRGSDGSFVTRPATVADLDVSATVSDDGARLCLAVINRHASRAVEAMLDCGDGLPEVVVVHELGVENGLLDVNDLDHVDRVGVRRREARLDEGRFRFAPHSLTVLEFSLR